MYKALLAIASLVSASAFTPSARVARSSALKMSFDNEIGALPPTGYWDPLGLSADGDAAKFKNFREIELKHGRVAMLAVTGYLAQDSFRLPGAIDLDGTTFDSIPNGVAAIGAVSSLGWLQIVASIGYWELIGWEDSKRSDEPGDFGLDAGGSLINTPTKKADLLTKEIQNGRLAMLGIIELITHDIAKPAGEGLFTLHHF